MAMTLVATERRPRSVGTAAVSIATAATGLCALCLLSGDAGAFVGALAISAMALVAVLAGGASVPRTPPARARERRHVPYLRCVSAR
jgi:hypothetical protein